MELRLDILIENKDYFWAFCVSVVSMIFLGFVDPSSFQFSRILFISVVVARSVFVVIGFYYLYRKMPMHLVSLVAKLLVAYEKIPGVLIRVKKLALVLEALRTQFLLGLVYFVWAAFYLTIILADLLRITAEFS